MNFAHLIRQFLVDGNAVANSDYTLELRGKVADVLVECLDDSGYDAIIGWNESPTKDVIGIGKAKSYGVAERGFLDGNTLNINFVPGGAGSKRCLVTVWTQTDEEIC